MGTINDRSGLHLTEAEDIKKGRQEYTELTKKIFMTQIIMMVWSFILECEVKWALGSITMNKASGGNGIPFELFQNLKDDAVKVLHSICQQIGGLNNDHGTGKGQFSFQSQRKAMPKNAQTTIKLHSSHTLVK